MRNRVAIVGVGQTEARRFYTNVNYADLIQLAVGRALEDCELTLGDIDAFIFAMGPDASVGIEHPERWCLDNLGIRGKPVMRNTAGGTAAIVAAQIGFYHIASGLFDTVLVAGAETMEVSGRSTQVLIKNMWDPFYERDSYLTGVSMMALSAVHYMDKYEATEEHFALIAVKNHQNALNNPYAHIRKAVSVQEVLNSPYVCWPLRLFECCPNSSGACAVVLGSEKKAATMPNRPVWVKGLGHSIESHWIGDKLGPYAAHDHADADGLELACRKAYQMAGITNPRREIDVAELYCPFPNIELHSVEAAGFCQKGEAPKLYEQGVFDMEGEIPVTPSGGVQCSHPVAATSLIRVAEAALQVRHEAGDRQVEDVQTALATGCGGAHDCFAAIVLDRNK